MHRKLLSGLAIVACGLMFMVPVYLSPEQFPTDDAFFYYQVASQIYEGNGSTFNGITPTNGYHPLWMLVCVAAFYFCGGDKIAAQYLLVAIQHLLFAGIVYLFYRLARRVSMEFWYVALLLLAFGFLATAMYGTEAFVNGLSVMLALMLFLHVLEADRPGSWALLGIVLALTFLSRLDNVFLVACLGLSAVLGRPGSTFSDVVRRGAWSGLPLAIVALPYLAYNEMTYGHLVPISGAIKSRFPVPGFHLKTLGSMGTVVALCGLLSLAYTLRMEPGGRRRRLMRALALGVVLHAGYVLLFVDDNMLTWYYIPGLINVALLAACIVEDLVSLADRFLDRRLVRGTLAAGTIVVALVGSLRAWSDYANPNTEGIHPFQFNAVAETKWQNDIGRWLKVNFPAGTKMFVHDWPGAIAYFSDLACVPEDGLISDYSYNEDILAMGIREYLSSKGVTHYLGPNPPRDDWLEQPMGADGVLHIKILAPLQRRKAGTLLLRPENIVVDLKKATGNRGMPVAFTVWKLDP